MIYNHCNGPSSLAQANLAILLSDEMGFSFDENLICFTPKFLTNPYFKKEFKLPCYSNFYSNILRYTLPTTISVSCPAISTTLMVIIFMPGFNAIFSVKDCSMGLISLI